VGFVDLEPTGPCDIDEIHRHGGNVDLDHLSAAEIDETRL
jgi:hypothetical protein